MKKIIEFFQSLFGVKKKPPVLVVPQIETKPEEKPVDIPIPQEKPIEPVQWPWKDRRPIGMVMLASHNGSTETDNYMNGEIPLSEWLVIHANNCIANMKEINAQGCIVWDPEGQKFPRPFTYYGDPILAKPEIDIFFKTITDAGFRVGVCIRPDQIVRNKDGWPIHFTVASAYENLKKKIEYAVNRWKCSLFYTDSNVGENLWKPTDPQTGKTLEIDNTHGAGNLMPVNIFSDLFRDFPGCLFIPEWANDDYRKYTMPYYHKHEPVPGNGGWVVDCGDTLLSIDQLTEIVKKGNILMGRVFWSGASELSKIKQAYEQA